MILPRPCYVPCWLLGMIPLFTHASLRHYLRNSNIHPPYHTCRKTTMRADRSAIVGLYKHKGCFLPLVHDRLLECLRVYCLLIIFCHQPWHSLIASILVLRGAHCSGTLELYLLFLYHANPVVQVYHALHHYKSKWCRLPLCASPANTVVDCTVYTHSSVRPAYPSCLVVVARPPTILRAFQKFEP